MDLAMTQEDPEACFAAFVAARKAGQESAAWDRYFELREHLAHGRQPKAFENYILRDACRHSYARLTKELRVRGII